MATQRKTTGTARKRTRKPATGPNAAGNTVEGGNGASGAEDGSESVIGDTALSIDGTPYRLGDLTLGELGELEDHVELPMDAVSFGSAKVIAFLVYLIRRRTNPEYTLADASNIKIGTVKSDREGEAGALAVTDRPTEAG